MDRSGNCFQTVSSVGLRKQRNPGRLLETAVEGTDLGDSMTSVQVIYGPGNHSTGSGFAIIVLKGRQYQSYRYSMSSEAPSIIALAQLVIILACSELGPPSIDAPLGLLNLCECITDLILWGSAYPELHPSLSVTRLAREVEALSIRRG
jgi:hypothetical protein